jgi:hypothetical protein
MPGRYQHRQKSPIGPVEGRVAIQQCRAVKLCPVTNGLPTVMSQVGFKKACKQAREQEKLSGALDARPYKFTHCATCKGKRLPQELRAVSLAELVGTHKKSREMQQHSPAR